MRDDRDTPLNEDDYLYWPEAKKSIHQVSSYSPGHMVTACALAALFLSVLSIVLHWLL